MPILVYVELCLLFSKPPIFLLQLIRKFAPMRNLIIILIAFFAFQAIQAQEFDDYKAFSSGKSAITYVTFSPDGSSFASGNSKGIVLIRDIDQSMITHIFVEHSQPVTHLSYSPDGRYLATTSSDGNVLVWSLERNELVFNSHELNQTANKGGEKPTLTFAHFNKEGNMLYYGGSEGKLYYVKLFQGSALKVATQNNPPFTSSDLHANGKHILFGTKKDIRLFNLDTQKMEKWIEACGGGEVIDVKFDASGTKIAGLCPDGTLTIWDMVTGEKLESKKVTKAGPSTQIAFSPDGKYLVTGDSKGTPKVWDATTMKKTSELEGHQGAIRSIQFSPDSKSILTGAADFQIKLWSFRKVFENVEIPVFNVPEKIGKLDNTPVVSTPKVGSLEELQLTYTMRNIPDSLGDRKVKTGKRVLVKSGTLEITLWDSEYEDGDIVSLFLNGEWILKEYLLTNKKKTLHVDISKNADNYLVLYAHNEGERPPNTAALAVFDGKNKKRVGLSSDMQTCDALKFEFRD